MSNKKLSSLEKQKNDEHKVFENVEEQVLHRAGQWIGSTRTVPNETYVLEDGYFIEREIDYNQGLAKIIEELIVNSVDEHVRTKNEPSKRGWVLNKVDVNISKDGKVSIHDNGGISTDFHSSGKRIVEVIFGSMFSSGNYDDSVTRQTVGTNGVGSVLCNIFSKRFEVTTADNKQQLNVVWSNNKTEMSEIKLKPLKQHYTKIDCDIDLARFGMSEIPDGVIQYLERVCLVLCSVNPTLEITFNGNPYKFKQFKDFVELFSDTIFIEEKSKNWEVILTPTLGNEPKVFGVVNGAECHKGEHIKMAKRIVNTILKDKMDKDKLPKLPPQQIASSYNVFVNILVDKPEYTAQNKDELASDLQSLNGNKKEDFKVAPKFEKDILNSPIYEYLKQLSISKNNALNTTELKKYAKELGKKRTSSIDKLVDATETNLIKRQEECELWIFEGGSASSGFRTGRLPKTQGCYSLKGKMLNSSNMKITEVLKNKEFSELVLAIGLDPLNPDDLSKIRYKSINFCTDMDWDGHAIYVLGLTFFATHFPKVIEQGYINRVITPLYKAEKNKKSHYFYDQKSFDEFTKENKGYDISYFKGIGSLTPQDLKIILREETILENIKINDNAYDFIEIFMQKNDDEKKGKLRNLLKNG